MLSVMTDKWAPDAKRADVKHEETYLILSLNIFSSFISSCHFSKDELLHELIERCTADSAKTLVLKPDLFQI